MKHAKKAFLASLLSVVLCVTMLVGTTYAWFTDSVTSAGNKIISGTLDIDLYQWTSETQSTEITDVSAPIFGSGASTIAQNVNADTLWEPGKTQVAYLSLKNNGSLWLKYTVKLVVKNVSKDLYEVMRYEIVPDAEYGDVTAWDGTNGVAIAQSIAAGASATIATGAASVPMAPGAEHFFALAIHMQEEAGNEYQAGEVDFDIQVLATQYTEEEDSFDELYDEQADETPDNAGWPFVNFTTDTQPVVANEATTLGDLATDGVQATISAGAVDGATSLTLVVKEVEDSNNVITIEAGNEAKYIDVSLYDQDKNIVESFEENGYADVELAIGTNLILSSVNHKTTTLTTTANADGEYYTYDPETGILTLHVTSFSPFSIGYKEAVWKVEDTLYLGYTSAMWASAVNKTLYLLKDTTLNALVVDKNFTIDLGGNTLTLRGHSSITSAIRVYGLTDYNGNLTISNGTLNLTGANYSNYGIYSEGNLTVKDLTVNSACKTVIYQDGLAWNTVGTASFENVTINATNASGTAYNAHSVSMYGTIYSPSSFFKNCTINSAYDGISINATNVEIDSCSITGANRGAWILFSATGNTTGTMTIKGSTSLYGGSDYSRLRAQDGNTIEVLEGTYNFDPTSYVDTNAYTITPGDGTWTVESKLVGPGSGESIEESENDL